MKLSEAAHDELMAMVEECTRWPEHEWWFSLHQNLMEEIAAAGYVRKDLVGATGPGGTIGPIWVFTEEGKGKSGDF